MSRSSTEFTPVLSRNAEHSLHEFMPNWLSKARHRSGRSTARTQRLRSGPYGGRAGIRTGDGTGVTGTVGATASDTRRLHGQYLT